MAITATYGSTTFTNVRGYLLSACLTPGQGFQGHFWVNIKDSVDAQQKPVPMNLGPAGPVPVANLQINGAHRSYQFPNLTLQSVEPGATRRERYRIAEFNYPHTPSVAQTIPAKFQNRGDVVLQPGALGNDFVWGIEAYPQHLLGFRARVSAADSVVVRFAAMRNARNSMIERVVQLNNAQAADPNQAMPDLAVNFAQRNLVLTNKNVVRLYVQELYGDCTTWATPTMSDYVSNGAGAPLARLNPPAHTAHELMRDEIERGYEHGANQFTVEITTIVFVPGHYRDLLIG
jgi:hypothetical protein